MRRRKAQLQGACHGELERIASRRANQAVFWTLPTASLSGTATVGATALINSDGNLVGFGGPYLDRLGQGRDRLDLDRTFSRSPCCR